MNGLNNELGRREFLKRATQAAAAGVISTGIASGVVPNEQKIDLADTIPARVLGKTGMKLPILGYGGAGLVKVWGSPLSRENRVKLLRYAYDRGVRYYDTAGNYMESQAILGEALKDVRDKVFLTSKVEVMRAGRTTQAFEKVLGEMKTDYLDAILIHGTPGLEQMTVKEAMKVRGELVKLRDEGTVRFIGFSAHSYFDKALALIESGGFDLCMLSYGYIPRGYDQIWTARMTELRNACIAKAHERDMGIVAMKVVGGGVLGTWSGYIVPEFDKKRLKQLPAAAIRYVLDDERIHVLVIGMRLKEEVDANIKTLSGDLSYTLDDRALLSGFMAKAYDSDAMKKMRIDGGESERPTIDIWTAAAQGNIEAIKQQLAAGAQLNARESAGGSTPLILAALFGQTEAGRLLLEKGADLNVKNNEGLTALHTAAFLCHPETVKLLLEKGADVTAKNNDGQTRLDIVQGEWSETVEGIYRTIGRILQIQLDLERIKAVRPQVAELLRKHASQSRRQNE